VLLARVETIAALRERILGAAVQVPWIPALQKDTRARNTHSSTAIEGNPLQGNDQLKVNVVQTVKSRNRLKEGDLVFQVV